MSDYFERAKFEFEKGKLVEARRFAILSTESSPLNVERWVWLGEIEQDLELFDSAIASFRRAVEIDPDNAVAHSGLGRSLADAGRHEEAVEAFRVGVQLAPTSSRYTLLGIACERAGDSNSSVENLLCAINLNPKNDEALFHLGVVYQEIGRFPDALSALRNSLKLDPENACTLREMGKIFARTGNVDEAVTMFREAIQKNRLECWARVYLGNAYWVLGREQDAERVFRDTCDVCSHWAPAYWCFGHFLNVQDRLQEAEAHCRIAVELDAEDASATFHLAEVLYQLGNTDEAKQLFVQTLESDPQHMRAGEALESLF